MRNKKFEGAYPGDIRSVLVIDDDEALAGGLAKLLQRNGYTAHAVYHGRAGLDFLAVEPVDLVITDIFMEEMEGLETIRAIKQRHPDTRIIAISGGAQIMGRDFLDVALAIGAEKTIRKPVTAVMLLSTIKELGSPGLKVIQLPQEPRPCQDVRLAGLDD